MRLMLTRPRRDSEVTAERLAELGIDCLIEPMIEIEPTGAPIDLDGAQAILVTSANAVEPLSRSGDPVRTLPLFTVGDATARALLETGFSRVESADGNADDLVALVCAQLDPRAGWLSYPHGEPLSADLAALLASAGFQVRATLVYKQRPTPHLSSQGLAALRHGQVDGVLFMSARTARTFVELAQRDGWSEVVRSLTAFSLSHNVAEALRELPWAGIRIAPRPRLDALLEIVHDGAETGEEDRES